MKVIMVMFDTLNRRMLEPYGCDWVHTPNFTRLAQRTVTFNNSYVCSMPCMPTRRDMHTGRPNFLHRSWGPLEPFDDSLPHILKNNGVYSHLASDHYHYWETGGATYHTAYSTWQAFRGQEGDPWMGQVKDPKIPDCVDDKGNSNLWRQDWVNRSFMPYEQLQPQAKTMTAGLDFINRNSDEDNWFLHIETFDPHEPFFTQRKYKDLYAEHYDKYKGKHFDWPNYGYVKETKEEVEHARCECAALTSMCDHYIGEVINAMDKNNLWEDTMLIVWTDHGWLLGEHDSWAKCWAPFYNEVAHTPFFVWDPRSAQQGQTRDALVQPALDIAPTMLNFFNMEPTPDMTGKNLAPAVADDTPVREASIYGLHGGQVNVTDSRYVYMRAPAGKYNTPLNNYTLMPTHMNHMFTVDELRDNIELAEPFTFTKGCKTMKIPFTNKRIVQNEHNFQTMLFDLKSDPQQLNPIKDTAVEQKMITHMTQLMREADAPPEQFQRLGLT